MNSNASTFALIVLMLVLAVRAAAQQPLDLYQRALAQEHATGHLGDAIALFTEVARTANADRALAARALVRAAGCYEKLGRRTDAENLYIEVMRTYPEQRAEVSLAQERSRILRRQASMGVDASTASVIERYCVRCHNAGNKSAGLDFASLKEQPVAENTGVWEQVVRRLLAGRDPPVGAPRPDDESYRDATERLQLNLDAAYAANPVLNTAERVDDSALATRLAALIWNAEPDASLLADAKRSRLHDADVLNRQVARMLRDSKSSHLVDAFFAGWLSLAAVKTATADADLAQAMETETRLFLESQLREDRDAVEIWTANYTYINARLARHYGVSIAGQDFRRVTWQDDRRAGILGQAGILTALSKPTRTSPTTRGRFVLSRFFGVDAPSPPANVAALVESPATRGTMRERILAHKVNPSCASCHSLFDPLGLALENFDATGAWRTLDDGLPIDASGTFVDGTRFDGPAALRTALLKYREAYYTALTQRFLAHALSRKKTGQVYDYEMADVRKIVRDAAARGNRWSAILAGVAASAPFQMKRPVP